jgi:DNA-binding transcriptional LysR family regulator
MTIVCIDILETILIESRKSNGQPPLSSDMVASGLDGSSNKTDRTRSGARGVALLPTFITAASLRDGTLRSFLDDYNAPPLALYALYPPTRHLAVKVRLFIDFLVDRFSNFPSWDQKV